MGEVDIKENDILYLKQGVKSIKGKSKENLLLFTYYGGKFEMAKGPKSGSLQPRMLILPHPYKELQYCIILMQLPSYITIHLTLTHNLSKHAFLLLPLTFHFP